MPIIIIKKEYKGVAHAFNMNVINIIEEKEKSKEKKPLGIVQWLFTFPVFVPHVRLLVHDQDVHCTYRGVLGTGPTLILQVYGKTWLISYGFT